MPDGVQDKHIFLIFNYNLFLIHLSIFIIYCNLLFMILEEGQRPITFKNVPKTRNPSRLGISVIIASLLTGVTWYTQSKIVAAEQKRINAIIEKVKVKQTSQFNELYDITKMNKVQGTKVQVTGTVQPGRVVVKRNRGDQQGYLVFAPFAVKNQKNAFDIVGSEFNEKFMINLGWVPKSSKHLIQESAANDVLTFDQLPDQYADDQEAVPKSTITAFVRKGEQRDILRGYNSWESERLFKYVDLSLMQKIFNSHLSASRYIYLDRIAEAESVDTFPLATTDEIYTQQLKEEIKYNEQYKNTITKGVGIASFLSAAVFTIF